MYLGFERIDSVCIEGEKIAEPGYVGSLKRVLLEKHAGEINAWITEPAFLVVHASEN